MATAEQRRAAIASIESSGNYNTVGVETKGDRPYGKYGIMGNNIGPWTKRVLGVEMSPQEFLGNPRAQDNVFDQIFAGYVDKYGEEGAARAWLGGEKGMKNLAATDRLGTSVGDYGKQYMRNLSSGPVEAAGGGAGNEAGQAREQATGGLRHVGGAGSGPANFTGGGQYTLKPEGKDRKADPYGLKGLGEGVAGVMSGQGDIGMGNAPVIQAPELFAPQAVPSVVRPAFQPTQAPLPAVGGGTDLRQLLAQLMAQQQRGGYG